MTGLETRRFDAKLDSFLRRNLAQEDFERVCTSEPCVVVSPEDKRVHRHAVLGHQCLYLTEVPPKNLKTALHIREISSIRMVGFTARVCGMGSVSMTPVSVIPAKFMSSSPSFSHYLSSLSPSASSPPPLLSHPIPILLPLSL